LLFKPDSISADSHPSHGVALIIATAGVSCWKELLPSFPNISKYVPYVPMSESSKYTFDYHTQIDGTISSPFLPIINQELSSTKQQVFWLLSSALSLLVVPKAITSPW
jgi:hypothetical protein